MKKNSKLGYLLLTIAFVFISVAAFVLPTSKNSVFWIVFAFTVVAFALQIVIWKASLGKAETLKRKFLGFSIIHIGLVYLLIQVIAFAVFTAVAALVPNWVPIIVCILILGISAICMLTIEVGKDELERVEQKVQKRVSAIKTLQVDVEMLAASEKDAEVKKTLTKLAEKIRYSDPMSSDELTAIEAEIVNQVQQLESADSKLAIIENIDHLVAERNAKCKLLK